MSQRLNEDQLKQIIAEVGELSRRQEAEFDREQIQEILQELNLPPELLDEAIIQLRRRQALAKQRQRDTLIVGGVVTALVIAIASMIFFSQQNNSAIANVQIQQDRLTLANDDGGKLNSVSRQVNPEVFYRVTLQDAPVGKKLNLSCNWVDPSGQIVKQNKYQTQEIDTSIWNTRCRYQINSAAKTGNWKVEMLLDGRLLGDESFEVK